MIENSIHEQSQFGMCWLSHCAQIRAHSCGLPMISHANTSVSTIFVLHIDNVFRVLHVFRKYLHKKDNNNSRYINERKHIHTHLGALNVYKMSIDSLWPTFYTWGIHTLAHTKYTYIIHTSTAEWWKHKQKYFDLSVQWVNGYGYSHRTTSAR